MSLIHPRPQIAQVHRVPLEAENARQLRAYARMIQSPDAWVINRALEYFFARDREFQQWLADQPPTADDSARRAAADEPVDEASS